MRFIHAADIHLDSPLQRLSPYPDAPADMLRITTREASNERPRHTCQPRGSL